MIGNGVPKKREDTGQKLHLPQRAKNVCFSPLDPLPNFAVSNFFIVCQLCVSLRITKIIQCQKGTHPMKKGHIFCFQNVEATSVAVAS